LTLEPLQAASLRTHQPSTFFGDALRRLQQDDSDAEVDEVPVRQNARPRPPRPPTRSPRRPERPDAVVAPEAPSED
jgi:hypothetical protein